MAKMKTFQVICCVVRAQGTQVFEVRAESLEEAKRKWAADEGAYDCVSEEIEVTEIGSPEFREVK